MSLRNNNLHVFTLKTFQDYVDMWHELDNDYQEPCSKDKTVTLAQSTLTKHFNEWDDCDASRLSQVLDWIKDGHGSYSTQFLYKFIESDDHVFSVSISYLT